MLIKEMTNEQLIQEWKKWNDKVATATNWGAALATSAAFRNDCERELRLRNLEIPNAR